MPALRMLVVALLCATGLLAESAVATLDGSAALPVSTRSGVADGHYRASGPGRLCLTAAAAGGLMMQECRTARASDLAGQPVPAQRWTTRRIIDGQVNIIHASRLCLTGNPGARTVRLGDCDGSAAQRWDGDTLAVRARSAGPLVLAYRPGTGNRVVLSPSADTQSNVVLIHPA